MTDFKVGDWVVTPDAGGAQIVSGNARDLFGLDIPGFKYIRYYGANELKPIPIQDHEGREIGFIGDSVSFHGEPEETTFALSVHRVTSKIADLLIAKNKAYGDSALNPVRIFSKASRIEQLNVRIDDKISRIQRGTDFGDEDTVRDLIGYLVLRLIAEESE